MKFRNISLLTILALVAFASFASADSYVQTQLFPTTLNSNCPPGTNNAGSPPGNYNDPCAPVSSLFGTSGTQQPTPPHTFTFGAFTPGSNGICSLCTLTGVTLYINTYAKTDVLVHNVTTDSSGNVVQGTGNLAPQLNSFLSLSTSGSNVTSSFFAQQLNGVAVNYGPSGIFGLYGDATNTSTSGTPNCSSKDPNVSPTCAAPGASTGSGTTADHGGYNLLPGGDAVGSSDETFDIRQWENNVTWTDGFPGALTGLGGGYHSTFDSSSNSSDRVPVEVLSGTTGTALTQGGNDSCDVSGICTLSYASLSGNGFNIYYQADGQTTGGQGSGAAIVTTLVGAGVGLKLVYSYNNPAIPEPGSLLLLGSGLSMVAAFVRRKVTRK